MTTGFEEAQERRNWLERLVDKIPGFRGFQDRELRRDVDKMQREHLALDMGGELDGSTGAPAEADDTVESRLARIEEKLDALVGERDRARAG